VYDQEGVGRRRSVKLVAGEDRNMKKSRLESLAIFGAIVFAWQRLGLKVTGIGKPYVKQSLRPDGTCPAGWIKLGNGCVKL